MLKVIKLTSVLVWGVIFSLLLIQQFSEPPLVPSLFYLWVLVGGILFIKLYKKESKFAVFIFFSLFLISGILAAASLVKVAEIIMRISFVFLIVALVQSLAEFKKSS